MIRCTPASPVLPRSLLLAAVLTVLPLFAEQTGGAPAESYELRLSRASQLAHAHDPKAIAEFQKLLKERPKDGKTLLEMGLTQAIQAQQLPDGDARRAALKEARYFIVRAQQAGLDSPIIATVLAEISPDGTETVPQFSKIPEANSRFQQAEAAFQRRDYAEAQRLYQAVLAVEPANYMARMGMGDSFYARGQFRESIDWFERAEELDPDKAIAHRYCGDALLKLGRKDDALGKYLSTVIADPYNGYSWQALHAGCQAMLLKPWIAAKKIPLAEVKDGPKGPEILLPKGFNALHIVYTAARAQWQTENKARRFPAGTAYRQTMEEEIHALSSLVKICGELKQSGQPPPAELAAALTDAESSIAELTEIEKSGLLPAHILLFRANQDIAQDYAAYRAAHREKLREYLWKYYLHLP